MNDPLSPGKQVLLRALDNISEIEENTGGSVEYLAVVYAVVSKKDDDTITTRGWDATDHPHFVITGLVREVAARIESDAIDPETDEDDE
jgi:hypothetical protein